MKNLITTLFLLFSTITLYPQIGGYALKFDGTDDYVSTNYNTQINIFTIECWVKGNSAPSYSTDGTGVVHRNHNYQINWNHPSPDFRGAAAINVGGTWHNASFGPLTGNVWYHLAATYDGENLRAYKNGVLMNTNTNPSGNPDNISENLTLGSHSDPSSGRYFGGMIDEVRIWDVVLTADEIKANMYKEISTHSNLKVYYKMSNGSGTTLTDNSGNNVSGTLTNGPTWLASGSFAGSRQALDFDGTDDYVAFSEAYSPAYNNTALTIEAWIKSTSTRTEEEIVNWGNNTDQNVVEFRMSTGNIEFGMDVSGWYYVSSNSKVNDGKWNHVAVTKDGNNLKLYINGKLDASGTISVSPSVNRMTIANVFQNNSYHSGRYEFLGQIDEIRIWNSVRTEDQLRENMMVNLVGNETGLIAYYRFDHYDGTTLYDCTNNGKNGTLTNMDAATDWVASTAFNTWIGSENSTWSTATNWSSGTAPVSTDNIGLYKWNLGNETDITGAPTVNHLLFSSLATPVLSSGFTVNGFLILGKNINLNGKEITLGTSGYLSEGNYRLYGSAGTITTSRPLSGLTSLTNIAGLGLSLKINSGGFSGNTVITRGHSEHLSGGLFYNTRRYYDVTASGTFNVDILYKYHQDELNGGSENDLRLYKSSDGGTTWIKQESAAFNASDNTFSLTNVTSMSRWTTADNSSPLPVELSSLTAKASGSSVIISWKTSTEVNNYGFEVERSLKTENPEWDKIGFVPGAGNSNSPKEYSFTDDLNDASLQSQNHKIRYRLKQIDSDGTSSFSKEVEIENLLPSAFELSQNYPNPFNPGTTIRFGLPADTRVTLEVFNIIGEKVATLLNNEIKSAGYYDVLFNASKLSSGIYFYRLTAGEFISTKKLNIIK